MYNGIGLQTARGSGTNGYVQTNKFFIKPRSTGGPGGPHRPPLPDAAGGDGTGLGGMRKPNRDILEHDRKRQVELKLLVLRDALEEQGYTEGEIEERVEEARRAAEAEAAAAAAAEEAGGGRPSLPGSRGYALVGVFQNLRNKKDKLYYGIKRTEWHSLGGYSDFGYT
jgi:serine/arginine repetitive matrix protein 2